MPISAGTAYVDIVPDFKKFGKELQQQTAQAGSGLKKFGDRASKAGNKLTLGLTLPLVGLGKVAFDAASDLNESMSKVNVVFGDSAEEIQDWAKDSAKAFGLSRAAALDAAGTIGNLFTALKLPQKEAVKMSKAMVELAGDLASFNNVPIDEALAALRSGLVGETEPLKRFGVNLNEATLKEKALSMGLIKTAKGVLPAAVKAQAAYALILEQTQTAQGDFQRTADGAANKQRILTAQFQDAAATIGQQLLPIGIKLLGFVSKLFERFQGLSPETQSLILKVGLLAVALGPVVKLGGTLAKTMGALKKGFALARAAIVRFTGAKLAEKTALEANNKAAKAGASAAGGLGAAVKKAAPALVTAAKGATALAGAYAIGTVSSESLGQAHKNTSKQVQEFVRQIRTGRIDVNRSSESIRGLSNYLVNLAKRGESAAVAAIKHAVAERHGAAAADRAAAAAEKLLGVYKPLTVGTHKLADAVVRLPKLKAINITTPGMAAALSNLNKLRERLGDVGSIGIRIYSDQLAERQHGGPVWPGERYLVGERGPEILQMGSMGGRVVPNHELAAMRSGDTFNVTVNNPKPERLEITLPAALRRMELMRARG